MLFNCYPSFPKRLLDPTPSASLSWPELALGRLELPSTVTRFGLFGFGIFWNILRFDLFGFGISWNILFGHEDKFILALELPSTVTRWQLIQFWPIYINEIYMNLILNIEPSLNLKRWLIWWKPKTRMPMSAVSLTGSTSFPRRWTSMLNNMQ